MFYAIMILVGLSIVYVGRRTLTIHNETHQAIMDVVFYWLGCFIIGSTLVEIFK